MTQNIAHMMNGKLDPFDILFNHVTLFMRSLIMLIVSR